MHRMQRGLATRKLSVRPSVKRVDCDKAEEKFIQIFILYERSFSLTKTHTPQELYTIRVVNFLLGYIV